MADGRKKNGGARPGSGRKPKSEEQALIEKLKPHDDTAISTLVDLVKSGDVRALTLFMSYRFGKPKETVAHEVSDNTVAVPVISWTKDGSKD
jgi:hypothetical protein